MRWDGWLDFLAMGGYAVYVWGAYGVALALVLTELTLLLLRKRAILGHLGWNSGAFEPAGDPAHGADDSRVEPRIEPARNLAPALAASVAPVHNGNQEIVVLIDREAP